MKLRWVTGLMWAGSYWMSAALTKLAAGLINWPGPRVP